jgi:hypothetical protein
LVVLDTPPLLTAAVALVVALFVDDELLQAPKASTGTIESERNPRRRTATR